MFVSGDNQICRKQQPSRKKQRTENESAGPKNPYQRRVDCYSHQAVTQAAQDKAQPYRQIIVAGLGFCIADKCIEAEIQVAPAHKKK